MKLVSQVNGDGDIIEAWLRHYVALGIDEFLLVLHGPERDNEALLGLKSRFPITIVDRYETEYSPQEKRNRQNTVLDSLRGQWVMLVDSDEFVELPYSSVRETVKVMELLMTRALAAPMLQRITASGSLSCPSTITDVGATFPQCAPGLYRRLGSDAEESKYPLFRCDPDACVGDGGNHIPPFSLRSVESPLLGVTHHYKWRPILRSRLESRIASGHSFKHQSEAYLRYLIDHDWTLPVDGTFSYSRDALFERGLLRRLDLMSGLRYFAKAIRAKLTGVKASLGVG